MWSFLLSILCILAMFGLSTRAGENNLIPALEPVHDGSVCAIISDKFGELACSVLLRPHQCALILWRIVHRESRLYRGHSRFPFCFGLVDDLLGFGFLDQIVNVDAIITSLCSSFSNFGT
jgi:hypothetical protein